MTAGTHGEDLTRDRNIRFLSLCMPYAFATMHGYPVYSGFSRSRLDPEVVPFLAHLTAAFAQKPVLFSEFGNPTCPPHKLSPFERVALPDEPPNPTISPDDPVLAPYACLTEAEMAAYCTDVLERLHADGRLGAYWWCWADYADALRGEPPFDASAARAVVRHRARRRQREAGRRGARRVRPRAAQRRRARRHAGDRRHVLLPHAARQHEDLVRRVGALHRGTARRRAVSGPVRENTLKRRLQAGETVVGTWMNLAEPLVAGLLASHGWDWLLIDMEHGPVPLADAAAMVTAVRAQGGVPIVRAAWNESSQIQRVLDLGAWGIMVPVVNTADDARRAVRDARFPPLGERSRGGVRANLTFDTDPGTYSLRANDEVLLLVQVETEESVAQRGGDPRGRRRRRRVRRAQRPRVLRRQAVAGGVGERRRVHEADRRGAARGGGRGQVRRDPRARGAAGERR